MYEPFKNIPDIEKQLYTSFSYNKVNFINNDIIKRYVHLGDGLTFNQRCISFDTQTVSYLKKYYDGKQKSIPTNISSVIELMKLHNIGVDYLPYTLENLLYNRANYKDVFDTLFAFEKLYSNNTKSDRYCLKQANKILTIYKKMAGTREFEELNQLYQKIYSTLLCMISIQLQNANSSLEEKMCLLYLFMNNELGFFTIPETTVAHNYFEKGQNYTFFGKIQKNSRKIISDIKNMAWDLFHLRFMEFECQHFDDRKVDIFLPYMFSYDKRLFEISKCFELKAIAILIKTNERFPFYVINTMPKNLQEHYFSNKEIAGRRERNETLDIIRLISKYENIITKLVKE